jgi:hypothetical protein
MLNNPELLEPRDVKFDRLRSYMNGNESDGGHVRIFWSMLSGSDAFKPLDEWALRVYAWGLETPCMPTNDSPPPRPAWPIPALAPVSEVLLSLYGAVGSLYVPLDGARGDIILAVVERLRQLTVRIMDRTHDDDGLTAEILTRCVADSALQVRWLIWKDDDALYAQFKERSYGNERERIERVHKEVAATAGIPEEFRRGLSRSYAELAADFGTWPELLDVVYGPWSDKASGTMLRELPKWEESAIGHAWYSGGDAIHGSWRNLRKYSMERCTNALHLSHSVVTDSPTKSAGIVPVIASFIMGFEVLDDVFKLYPPPLDMELQVRLDETRRILSEWVATHLTSDGFRWFDD